MHIVIRQVIRNFYSQMSLVMRCPSLELDGNECIKGAENSCNLAFNKITRHYFTVLMRSKACYIIQSNESIHIQPPYDDLRKVFVLINMQKKIHYMDIKQVFRIITIKYSL